MIPSVFKLILISLLLLIRADIAAAAPIPLADDLSRLATQAKAQRIPIMLLISQYHCSFCERMKSEVLQPMQLSGDYQDRVLIRELMMDPGGRVTNFKGRREDASAFAEHYRISVTPTLLFLDPEGREVAERILGINTVDYLLFYIEDAIDTATATMASSTEAAH
jgi:thioredoxin-related protein